MREDYLDVLSRFMARPPRARSRYTAPYTECVATIFSRSRSKTRSKQFVGFFLFLFPIHYTRIIIFAQFVHSYPSENVARRGGTRSCTTDFETSNSKRISVIVLFILDFLCFQLFAYFSSGNFSASACITTVTISSHYLNNYYSTEN